jgi:hypothetical protein
MKIAVVGTNLFNNFNILSKIITRIIKEMQVSNIEILTTKENFFNKTSKEQFGVSYFAKEYAKKHQYLYKTFAIEWLNLSLPGAQIKEKNGKKYNAKAYIHRNAELVKAADIVIIIHREEPSALIFLKTAQIEKKIIFNFNLSKILKTTPNE